MPNGLFHLSFLTGLFPIYGVSSLFSVLPFITEIPVFNANSVDPDQMPHFVASNLGLHCLPVSLLWDAMHKWVNNHD